MAIATCVCLAASVAGGSSASSNSGVPSTQPSKLPASLTVYDGQLKEGFVDLGWGPRTINKGPAKVDVGGWQGWVVGRPGVDLSSYATLSVSVRIPSSEKPVALVRVANDGDTTFPPKSLGSGTIDAERWIRYDLAMSQLNPKGKPFDRVLLTASRLASANTFVEFDKMVFSGRRTPVQPPASAVASGQPKPRASKPVAVGVDCSSDRKIISPLIYGNAFNSLTEDSQTSQFTMGATVRRWGGDWSSRFNWEQGNAWNPGFNWYWKNQAIVSKGNAWQTFFTNNAKAGMSTALTVPTLGWVAKDSTSYSFSVKSLGAQQSTAPETPDAGNGVAANGSLLKAPRPETTSIKSTPASIGAWIKAISDGGWSSRSALDMVFLDNEPDLWNSTHRDIHPTASTYDELLMKSKLYAASVRAANPTVKIAGPSSWGWWGYFYSAADAEAGFSAKPDRRSKNDVPFLEWYLTEMAKEEQRTGKRLLDILDIHYYPSAPGVHDASGGKTDKASNEARVRSTRSLWDPSYIEESWVGAPVFLIPRMQDIINRFKPGIGLSIGEYNFGGAGHITGAIAQAEALGRFGQNGLTAAFLWTHPLDKSEQYWGFRTFRNYDGRGGSFLQNSVKTTSDRDLSVFASTDAFTNQQVVVMINKSGSTPMAAKVKLSQCGKVSSVSRWTYAGGPAGFQSLAPVTSNGSDADVMVDPWTIQILRFD